MDEVKDMLKAILGRLEEQGAEIKRIHERLTHLERTDKQIQARTDELKEVMLDHRRDIQLVVQKLGEHDHEIRKLKMG